jgi:hypothetical protein
MRFLLALAALLLGTAAQACLFARDARPRDWYEWAQALFAADVTSVQNQNRTDVVALRVVETYKGPAGAATATLRMPEQMWARCRLERPAVGARVLAALNPNGDALVVPLAATYADELRAARPGPAVPIASQMPTPAPNAPAPSSPAPSASVQAPPPPVAARCVLTPLYGVTVKVEHCEQAEGGPLYLRGEILRLARENAVPLPDGVPMPVRGQRYLFYKPTGLCQDFDKNAALIATLSHPCCDANQPYCARSVDFLVDDGVGSPAMRSPSAPAPRSR